jgi:hypothetical protein
MRYLAAPDFTSKVAHLPHDAMQVVRDVLIFVSTNGREMISSDRRVQRLVSEASDILVFRTDGYRVLFTFGSNNDGEYLLLVDLISESGIGSGPGGGRLFTKRDPSRDASVNPLRNNQINPRSNSRLNPVFNSQINPTFNSRINPTFNSQINPTFNSQVNPTFNSQINPTFNSALNPMFNSSINPKRNTLMGGPFLYDLNLNQVGYLVKANERVSLVFDMNGRHLLTAVAHAHGFAVFDAKNKWLENWIENGRGGYLRFHPNANWIGFVV